MIEVMIKLNPAFDGIEIEGDEPKDIEGSCLVISTNGDYKTVDVDGAIEIMDALGDDTRVDFIYNTSYAMAYNRRKVINIDGSKFLIGSVLIANLDKDIVMTDAEIEEVKNQFISRLIKIKFGPNQTVTAYEL